MEQVLGPEAKLKVEIVAGKIRIAVDYDGKQVDASASISSDSDILIDAILALIPGDSAFEKAMGELLKSALKAVTV